MGTLFVLAGFMAVYGPGLEHAPMQTGIYKVARVVGAISALGVAMFPTDRPDAAERVLLSSTEKLPDWVSTVHYVSAIVLFLLLGAFGVAFWHAVKDNPDEKSLGIVSLVFAIAVLVAIVWGVYEGRTSKDILLPEILAIEAFALALPRLLRAEAPRPELRLAQRPTCRGRRKPRLPTT